MFEKGDTEEGRKSYERAIELRPDDLPLQKKFHFEYGRALARTGDASAARREFGKAKRIDATFVPTEDINAELDKLGVEP